MKKSFMTRALATGLSLAMAFSLSAATNVTTAEAASLMKASSKTVTEGKTAKAYMTSSMAKKYRIKSHKESTVAKKYISVAMMSSRKGLKITAKEGALAAANLEKKGVQVKINFVKASSAKAAKKATKIAKTATIKVVVKAKPVEKLTMTAEVTGVKTIAVKFNKAIADASKVKVTVKKGTADRACKATVNSTDIKLAMDAKLTKGSYTVSVEGVDTEVMTANLEVEKDETLTSFEIADYIVAKSINNSTAGTIKFAALNQYGEKMAAADPTATCSFGTVTNAGKPSKSATATAEGEITVENINSVLTIVGTTGTVVLVGDMGVTATKTISFNTAATATTVEIVGTYHKNSAKLKNISENDNIADYELLFTAKDQYGYAMSANELSGLNISLVGGLTNLDKRAGLTNRTLDGVDYVAISLVGAVNTSGKAVAGDATLMIVNPYKGLLTNTTVSVAKSTIVKNITITADNGVYEDQDNEMGYEIVDAEGNVLTSYVDITSCVTLPGNMRFERQKDGTAKLLYNPGMCVTPQPNTDKASTPKVVTVYANKQVSGDYLVKTFTFTVNQKRYAKGVIGIKEDKVTSVSVNGANFDINSTDIVLADQYSNKVTDSESIFNKNLFAGTTTATGTSVYVVANGAANVTIQNQKLVVDPLAAGTATVYLKYCYDPAKPVTASPSDYDAKFNISVYDTGSVDVSTLAIDSVKDGFSVKDDYTLTVDDIKVTAMVGGTKTVIPTSQYVIVKNENNSFNSDDEAKGVTSKKAKVTVQVTTWDSTNTSIETQISKEYEVLDKDKVDTKLFKVTDKVGDLTKIGKVSCGAVDFVEQFKFKDQYGVEGTGSAAASKVDCVNYTIQMIEASDKNGYTITSNGLNAAKLEIKSFGYYKFKITATTPDGSSKDFTLTINPS